MTWDEFASLTAAQKNKLAQFAAIGAALGGAGPNPNPDISMVNYSQAKAAEAWLRELHSLVGPAAEGVKHVRRKAREAALAALEAANP